MLSPLNALTAAREVHSQQILEARRLAPIHAALKPLQPGDEIPDVLVPRDAPPIMRELARRARTNYLPLVLDTFAQVLKVDGYFSKTTDGAVEPWQWWQRNRMDSLQAPLFRAALKYGSSYATVLPGTYGFGEPGPKITALSPRTMTAVYQDPVADTWPMLALDTGQSMWRLYDEEAVYFFGVERYRRPASESVIGVGHLTFLEARPHPAGVTPVVRFLDRSGLLGEQQMGIIEPLIELQDHLNEISFEYQVAMYFGAFKQRYVLGWAPEDEAQKLRANAAMTWHIDEDPTTIKIGEFSETSMSGYATALGDKKRDIAAIAQVPAQALGVDGISNISDATLAGLEAAKNRKAGEIATSLGESTEDLLRLCALLDGNLDAATDYDAEVRWRDFESRSYAQTVDGLVKLASGLGLPPEIALEDVPGMTEQKLSRITDQLRRQRARTTLNSLVSPNAVTG